MKSKGNIEELVRNVLGDAEIDPSPERWSSIQRKVRWSRFTRFDPGRFNIFYAGGLLVAGAGIISFLNVNETGEPVSLAGERTEIAGVPATRSASGILPESFTVTEVTGESVSVADMAVQDVEVGEMEISRSVSRENIGVTNQLHAVEGEKDAWKSRDTLNASPAGTHGSSVKIGQPDIGSPETVEIQHGTGNLMVFFTPSVLSGCAPLDVTFFNCSVNATTARWDFGTGEGSNEINPGFSFREPGTYTVALTAEDAVGQPSVFRQVIQVYPSPVAEFEIEEGLKTAEGVEEFNLLNYSSGAAGYTWDIPMTDSGSAGWSATAVQPVVRARELDMAARRIRLIATSEQGCADTLIRAFPETAGNASSLRFPTAFRPNTTGPSGGQYSPHEKRTDVFHPVFASVPADYRLRIFNRRGAMVFESRNIYQGWDGYFLQEHSAAGVYVWMAEGRWPDGGKFSLQGDVTLIRADQR